LSFHIGVKDTVVNLRRPREARKNKFDSSCGFVVMLRDFRVDLTVTYLSVRKAIATKGFCRVGVRFVETWTCSVRGVSLFVKILFELLKQRYKSKPRRHRTRTEQISFNFIKPCASGPPITDFGRSKRKTSGACRRSIRSRTFLVVPAASSGLQAIAVDHMEVGMRFTRPSRFAPARSNISPLQKQGLIYNRK